VEGLVSLRVLHVGCGGAPLPQPFDTEDETRLDIDPAMQPDIVASFTDMGDIGPFDVIYSCHTLEHLHPREVDQALKECLRVLVPGGTAIIIVPNLEGVLPTQDVLYDSPSGPVTGHDMIYGHKSCVENPFMAHHSGFMGDTLKAAMLKAGFAHVTSSADQFRNLIAGGVKAP
jgi:SAM-dependent methyltransferase